MAVTVIDARTAKINVESMRVNLMMRLKWVKCL